MRIRLRTVAHRYRRTSRPGSLRLERIGANGHAVFRVAAALLLGLFALMPPFVLHAFSDGNPWAPLLALPLFTLFPWYPTLGAMAWVLGEALGSWRWIEVDGRAGEVRARRDAWFLLGWRRMRVSEDAIAALSVTRRHEDAGSTSAPARLRIEHRGRKWLLLSGRRTTGLPASEGGRDPRRDAYRTAFRVAGLLGWRGYRAERDDHLETTVALERETSGPGVRAVPPMAGSDPGERVEEIRPGDGGMGARAAPGGVGRLPERDLPPFEPGALGSRYEVPTWRPGTRIHLRREGMSRGEAVRASVIGTLLLNLPTIAAGIAILTGAAGDVGLFWKLVVLLVFLFVTFLLNAWVWTQGRASREAELDWAAGLCRLRKDGRRVEVPFRRISEVEVRGYRRSRRGESRGARYRCEVLIRTPEGLGSLAETGVEASPDAAYAVAGRMAEDLADALGVPWRWAGWEERSVWDDARELALKLWIRAGPGDRPGPPGPPVRSGEVTPR